MADLKERNIALVSKDSDGVTTIDYPLTSTEMVEGLEDYVKKHGGTVKTVNGQAPDSSGNITLKIDAGGLPVGHEFFTTNPNIPAGCIPLLGGEYSRTAYADLWAWVQTQSGYLLEESAWQAKAAANGGNVPYYSKGNGSTTFRVPALKCWVRGANSIDEVGGYLVAGLPNIQGSVGAAGAPVSNKSTRDTYISVYDGPFGIKEGKSHWAGGHSTNTMASDVITFDASKTNPIYGYSDTVQPPSIVGLWVVKAYGTVTNVGSTDVANISTGLTQAETRISALENHGAGATVVESYYNGTEWYRVWSDGWLEQGGIGAQKESIITFLKPFATTNYTLVGSQNSSANDYGNYAYNFTSKKTTSFILKTASGQSDNERGSWYACGQGA
nr:MAG TPA: short tail fiber protein [Caudoviricetes sp.]